MTLFLHRAPRADLLADQPRRPARRPARPTRSPPRSWSSPPAVSSAGCRSGSPTGSASVPASGDGVCAGVRFLSPRSLVAAAARPRARRRLGPRPLVWPLLEVLDARLDEPWAATLARHLGHGVDGRRRPTCAAPVAGRSRGGWPASSRRTPCNGRPGRPTGARAATPTARARLSTTTCAGSRSCGAGCSTRSRSRRPTCATPRPVSRLRDGDPGCLDLPDRLSLFGHTRLPVTEVELLGGARRAPRRPPVAARSPRRRSGTTLRGLGGVVARDDDDVRRAGRPPAAGLAGPRHPRAEPGPRRRRRRGAARRRRWPERATLLGWLQADLRANRAPDADASGRRGSPTADDRSLQVHACHGAARQVDVLREVLVGLLDDDPTLEPRDILVMCPDIETYAPLIAAGVRARGRGRRTATPPTGSGSGSPTGRCPAPTRCSAWPPGWSSSPAAGSPRARCSTWPAPTSYAAASGSTTTTSTGSPTGSGAAGIRWGLDAEQRAGFGMQRFAHNTWRAGLDRLLLGAAMSGDDHATSAAGCPLDDVGSGDLDLLGRLRRAASTGSQRTLAALDRRPARSAEWVGGAARGRRRSGRGRPRAALAGAPVRARAGPGRSTRPATATRWRCGCPTSAPCSTPGWAAAPPAPTSAPAPSPSARWCRCARCPTGWSAWSGSTTASSRG